MNLRILGSLAFALALSPAFAQTPETAKDAKQDMQQQQQKEPLQMQSSGGEDWSMIPNSDKGYVTMQDAQPNSWLHNNFKTCDADKDGKVTKDEYTKCQRPQR